MLLSAPLGCDSWVLCVAASMGYRPLSLLSLVPACCSYVFAGPPCISHVLAHLFSFPRCETLDFLCCTQQHHKTFPSILLCCSRGNLARLQLQLRKQPINQPLMLAGQYRFGLVPPEMRSAALRRFVSDQSVTPPGDNGGGLERGDLIRPTGAVLKFIHSDNPEDKTGPKFEASFEVRGAGKGFGRELLSGILLVWTSSCVLAGSSCLCC